jgi:hypothetical protein
MYQLNVLTIFGAGLNVQGTIYPAGKQRSLLLSHLPLVLDIRPGPNEEKDDFLMGILL